MRKWPLRLQGVARRWGWVLLLALAPLFLFTNAAVTPVLLVVPALLAFVWANFAGSPAEDRRTPLDWALLLLAVMVLVSLWANFSIAFSLPKIAGLVFGLGLFYAAVARGRAVPGGWADVVAVYLLLGAGVATLGLLGTQWSTKVPILGALAARLPGNLISLPGAESGLQPNEVAGVLVWVVPVAVALAVALWLHFGALLQAHGGPAATTAVVSVTLVAQSTGGVLVLTQSRSALFGLALALITMPALAVWLRQRARRTGGETRTWRLRAIAILLIFAIGLVGVGLRFQLAIFEYAQGVLDPPLPNVSTSIQLNNLDGRLEIWSMAISGIREFPYTGLGLNTFRLRLDAAFPNADLGHAHNTWLQVALDLGLPGLVAYLGLWLSTIVMLVQVLCRSARTPMLRALSLGILGSFAGSFVYGLTDTVALGARPGFLWWLMLALAVLAWTESEPRGAYSNSQPVALAASIVGKGSELGGT